MDSNGFGVAVKKFELSSNILYIFTTGLSLGAALCRVWDGVLFTVHPAVI